MRDFPLYKGFPFTRDEPEARPEAPGSSEDARSQRANSAVGHARARGSRLPRRRWQEAHGGRGGAPAAVAVARVATGRASHVSIAAQARRSRRPRDQRRERWRVPARCVPDPSRARPVATRFASRPRPAVRRPGVPPVAGRPRKTRELARSQGSATSSRALLSFRRRLATMRPGAYRRIVAGIHRNTVLCNSP